MLTRRSQTEWPGNAECTVQYMVHYGPNKTVLFMIERRTKSRQVIENLVELVGIEPTTSSLRTIMLYDCDTIISTT
jgi:hypothetical protein